MSSKTQTIRSLVFLFAGTLLLTISYAFNLFSITDSNYKFFDRGDESNIIGRLLVSRTEGIASEGFLTGNYYDYKYKLQEGETVPLSSLTPKEQRSYNEQSSQNYDDFINDRTLYDGTFAPYKTQPGGQAFMYVVLDHLLPISGKYKLILFRMITILLSALLLTLFAKWTSSNYGFFVGLAVFALIFISPWFFRFAYSLWWTLWSYYIPFIFLLFYLDKKRRDANPKLDLKFYGLLCLAIFIKFFFTGPEFLTTTLVMAICPIIYHLYVTRETFKSSIIYLSKSSIACILGVLLGMLLLVVQIKMLTGSWLSGFEHIIDSFVKRSAYGESSDFKVLDIVLMYFKGEALYYEGIHFPSISFGFLFLLISCASGGILYMSPKQADHGIQIKSRALVLTTFISVLAPLSWVVIFSEHAFTHSHIDYIVWYMPYLLYGYCIIALFCQQSISFALSKKRNIG